MEGVTAGEGTINRAEPLATRELEVQGVCRGPAPGGRDAARRQVCGDCVPGVTPLFLLSRRQSLQLVRIRQEEEQETDADSEAWGGEHTGKVWRSVVANLKRSQLMK